MPRHSNKPRNFKCPHCDKSYVQKCHLKVHMDLKHSENPPEPPPKETLPCTYGCGMIFNSQKDLKRHAKLRHDESMPIVCSLCNCRFTKKRAMRQHCARVHKETLQEDPELKEKIYSESCKVCGMTFTSQAKLNRHMATKHTEKAFECDECNVKFAFERDLRDHIKSVHKKKRTCDYCKQEFEGTYKKFSAHKKQCLKVHGPKHKCHYAGCFASFNKKYNLCVHLDTVHNERTTDFKCSLCQKTFARKKIVQVHLQNVHKVTKVSLDTLYTEVPYTEDAADDDEEEMDEEIEDASAELDAMIGEMTAESSTTTTSTNPPSAVSNTTTTTTATSLLLMEPSAAANTTLQQHDLLTEPDFFADIGNIGFTDSYNVDPFGSASTDIFSTTVPPPVMNTTTANPFMPQAAAPRMSGHKRKRKRQEFMKTSGANSTEGTTAPQQVSEEDALSLDSNILQMIEDGKCELEDVQGEVSRARKKKRGDYTGSSLDRIFGSA